MNLSNSKKSGLQIRGVADVKRHPNYAGCV